MILYIGLALIGIVGFILLTPLVLEVDTTNRVYRIRLRGIAASELIFPNGRLLFRIWVLGYHKEIDPFQAKKELPAPPSEKRKKRRKRFTISTILRKPRAVLRSFTVKYLYINIDTDDYLWNAWLYPLIVPLSREGRTFRINFNGEVDMRLRIENRLGKILVALFR